MNQDRVDFPNDLWYDKIRAISTNRKGKDKMTQNNEKTIKKKEDTTWVRRVTLYLASQTMTMFGSSLVQFAISWYITLTTGSGWMLTLSTVFGFLPQLFVSPIAGVWADRYDRRKLIVFSDAAIAVSTAILAALFLMGYESITLLLVVSVVRSIGSGIQAPATNALLTEIVPEDNLMRINGIHSTLLSLIMLASPAAAGWLYAHYPLSMIFFIDVATAAIGIGILMMLRIKKRTRVETTNENNVREEMMSGLKYVRDTRWLKQMFGFYVFFALLIGPVVFLTPLMVARSFGQDPWFLQMHEIIFSLGSIVGGILIGVLSDRLGNKVRLMLYSCLAFGLTTLMMGFSKTFTVYLIIMFFMGTTMPFTNTSFMTVLQRKVDTQMIGRVFGVASIIGSTMMPLSMIIFGPLADFMAIEHQLIITGALMVGMSLYGFRMKEAIVEGGA